MKNLLKLSILLSVLCVVSCSTEPLIEENPHSQIFQANDFNIGVSGTFNGEPFNIGHTSWLESNYPVAGTSTGSAPQAYISRISRKNEFSDVNPEDELIVGLSANFQVDDLIGSAFIGEHFWRDLAIADMEPGLAFLGEVRFNGDRYWTTLDPNGDIFNTFEITKVTQMPNDETLDSKYNDRLFVVEGKLQCLLKKATENGYTNELVIEHFSLMFLNN